MKVFMVSEECHGFIFLAATFEAAKRELIKSKWVSRYSPIWFVNANEEYGGDNTDLDTVYGDNWEKAFMVMNAEQLENMGFLIHEETVYE